MYQFPQGPSGHATHANVTTTSYTTSLSMMPVSMVPVSMMHVSMMHISILNPGAYCVAHKARRISYCPTFSIVGSMYCARGKNDVGVTIRQTLQR